MIKAILFDLDGLVITKKDKLFSQRVSEEMGLPYEQVSEFFTGEFRSLKKGPLFLLSILEHLLCITDF